MSIHQRLVKGQKLPGIPTDTWNALIRAAEWVEKNRLRLSYGKFEAESDGVNIQNNSGNDIDIGGVLGLDGAWITPTENLDAFKEGVALKGVKPTIPAHVANFGVAIEPIPNGKVGKVCIFGPCICRVQVDVDQKQQYADIKYNATDKLIARYSGGAEIVWKESGTGDKWAFVLLGPMSQQAYQGKLSANLFGSSSALMTTYLQGTAGAWSTAGYNLTVYGPLLMQSSQKLPSGAAVLVRGDRNSGLLVVENSDTCPS